MQYFQQVMAGLQILNFLFQAISQLKTTGTLNSEAIKAGGNVAVLIGQLGNIKELSAENVNAFLPELEQGLPALIGMFQSLQQHTATTA